MTINKKELYKLYMQWVDQVSEDLDWKTTFGPEEIVYAIADILEKHPELIKTNNMEEKLNVLYFSAPWCGPCKVFGPAFDEVVAEYGEEINVNKINVDENQELSRDHAVRSIPTLVFVKADKEIWRISGVLSKPSLREQIEKHK